MVQTAKAIEDAQSGRRAENLRLAMAYANRVLGSLYDLASPAEDRSIAPWALISAVVSTGASMITRNHVRLLVETAGADTKLRRDAKEASRWLAGVFSANKVSTELMPSLFIDAAVCNLGMAVVRVEAKNGVKRLTIDRVLPDEVIVADAQSIYGRPHQGFIKRYLDKHVAISLYGDTPEKRTILDKLEDDCPAFQGTYRPDMVALYEGWSRNGAHVVAVPGCTLAYEKWAYDFLPWAPLYVEKPLAGYWGRGWASMLYGYQCQLWSLNDSIEEIIRLGASPKWLNPIGSQVNPAALANEHLSIVDHTPGQAPKLEKFDPVPTALLNERQTIWNQGLADVGLSDWGVTGEKPGTISGAAMEQLRDREHGRLVTVGQEFEAAHVRLGEICLQLGPEVTDWKVQGRTPGDRDLQQVDFKRIATLITTAPWTVQPPAPVAAFPQSPAGKRQTIQKYVEAGMMSPADGAMALDLPDVSSEASLLYSLREEVLQQIDDILQDGESGYQSPETALIQVGGQMPAQLFLKAYFQAKRQGVDETKTDALLKWVSEADALLSQLKSPPPAQLAPTEVVAGGTTFQPQQAAPSSPTTPAVPPELSPLPG